ncbi:hypothetical protein [Salinispora mooreana]|uniref:hypothetical protein n=1 Tax=Salinispora mooreana TaxID=999545 RepID=UPI001CC54BF0|nr:hypothetical protein [Salinispora mooreana]
MTGRRAGPPRRLMLRLFPTVLRGRLMVLPGRLLVLPGRPMLLASGLWLRPRHLMAGRCRRCRSTRLRSPTD